MPTLIDTRYHYPYMIFIILIPLISSHTVLPVIRAPCNSAVINRIAVFLQAAQSPPLPPSSNGLNPCSQYRAPNTVLPIPCSQYRAPNTVLPIPCSQYRAPNTVLPIPCSQYRAPNTRTPCNRTPIPNSHTELPVTELPDSRYGI